MLDLADVMFRVGRAYGTPPGKCRAGGDEIRNGVNHGPFGEKNFFIPDGH
jgi:hypothetical protein